jgi:hypothetical protein
VVVGVRFSTRRAVRLLTGEQPQAVGAIHPEPSTHTACDKHNMLLAGNVSNRLMSWPVVANGGLPVVAPLSLAGAAHVAAPVAAPLCRPAVANGGIPVILCRHDACWSARLSGKGKRGRACLSCARRDSDPPPIRRLSREALEGTEQANARFPLVTRPTLCL